MLSDKKITWCENWLKKTLAKYPSIERNYLFEMASKAGLYTQGSYGSELSEALTNINVKVKCVNGDNGEFLYYAFYI